jgi:hypothetical protein
MNEQKSNRVASPAVNCVDPIASAKELTPLIRAHADPTPDEDHIIAFGHLMIVAVILVEDKRRFACRGRGS